MNLGRTPPPPSLKYVSGAPGGVAEHKVLQIMFHDFPSTKQNFSMTFKDRQWSSMNFQALKMKFLNFMTFQVFHDLYESWNK